MTSTTSNQGGEALASWERMLIAVVLVINLLLRVPLLFGPLDRPDWRQTENAYTAYRMMLEPVPSLLHPKVPYRGAADVHVNEFALHAYCVAWLYKLTGGEHLVVARLFSLAVFAGAALGFSAVVRRFLGSRVAAYAAVIFVSVPLSIFYSRAHHYDFMIMMFGFAFLHAALRFVDTGRTRYFAGAMVAACVAFLMKAPYAFYLWLPLTVYALWGVTWRQAMWRLLWIGSLGVAAVACAAALNHYRIALDRPYPESLVYPMKFTPEFLRRFFFGTVAMRFDAERWHNLLRRTWWIVCTPVGAVLAALAPLWGRRGATSRGVASAWALVMGLAAYVLLIFPMVSSPHDYYSIPLVAPVALLAGWSLAAVVGRVDRSSRIAAAGLAAVVLLILGATSAYALRRGEYFRHDGQRMEAGRVIGEATQPDDLIVSATLGRSTGWSDPRILYYARRRGWSIQWQDLDAADLAAFRSAGAAYLAVLVTTEALPDYKPERLVAGIRAQDTPLYDPDQGERIGDLYLYPLGVTEP